MLTTANPNMLISILPFLINNSKNVGTASPGNLLEIHILDLTPKQPNQKLCVQPSCLWSLLIFFLSLFELFIWVNKLRGVQHTLRLINILIIHLCACACVQSLQSCPTQYDPMDCRPPISPVHGILQARILEWVSMPSPRDPTHVSDVSRTGGRVHYH